MTRFNFVTGRPNANRTLTLMQSLSLTLTQTLTMTLIKQSRPARSNGVDLNRDFPSPLDAPDGPLAATGAEQPETAAIMRWTSETRFVASASMHEV